MIEIDIKKVSANEIIKNIEYEIKNKRNESKHKLNKPTINQSLDLPKQLERNSIYFLGKKIAKYLRFIGLDKFIDFIKKKIKINKFNHRYIISNFTDYDDEEFINNVYKIILQREADIYGKEEYLSKLRSRKLSKEDIILRLHFSKEGRGKNIRILGSKKRLVRMLIYKIPIFGYIIKLIFIIFRLPNLINRIEYELDKKASNDIVKDIKDWAIIELDKKASNDIVKDIRDWVIIELDKKASNDTIINYKEKLDLKILNSNENLKYAIKGKATKKDFELYLQTVIYVKEYMNLSSQKLNNLIDEAKMRLPNEILNKKELESIVKEEEHQYDAFYVAFEDKFRGTRAKIKERVRNYLPYISNLPFPKEEIQLLDIGCGRGEWLELLQDNDYIGVKGVDLNRVMVSKSKEFGLDVEQIDVIEYMSNLRNESLSIITGFHIIEHLPFKILMKLFEESFRVLKKGGMVIYETPNPENLLVGSCNFYTDPTHINPIPPETGEFLLQSNGFVKTEILRLNLMKEVKYIDNSAFNDVNDVLYACSKEQDYAIIGYKI